VGGKVEELRKKRFVEKMSFESGVEVRWMVNSGDAGNDELTCVRSDESDKSSKFKGEVPWEADSRGRVMHDGK